MAKQKMTYVDGFVLVVPKKNIAAYRAMAKLGAKTWKKYGALDYVECIADDMRPKGIVATFPKVLKLKKNEVAVFAYITYRSRAHRDQVNAKVMKDQEMGASGEEAMPFDMKRLSFGGFKVMVRM
jgi:uncharacterized protein YbaA (DUF1428 family)